VRTSTVSIGSSDVARLGEEIVAGLVMVDDRLTIGDELDVRVHRARVVGLLHIQPGWTGDVLVGYELVGLSSGRHCKHRDELETSEHLS